MEAYARAAIASQAEKLKQLHQYEEIAEHYAKCAVSPEALRDWVVTAQAGQSQPIAWFSEKHGDFMRHETKQAHVRLNSYTHKHGEFDKPLFDYPAPVRQPLMDDEIDALWDEPLTLPQKVQRRYIARAVEAEVTGATNAGHNRP